MDIVFSVSVDIDDVKIKIPALLVIEIFKGFRRNIMLQEQFTRDMKICVIRM